MNPEAKLEKPSRSKAQPRANGAAVQPQPEPQPQLRQQVDPVLAAQATLDFLTRASHMPGECARLKACEQYLQAIVQGRLKVENAEPLPAAAQ